MKIIVRLIFILLLAGAVAGVVLEQNAIGAARAEQQVLRSEAEEARRLTEQNKDIAKLREEHEELERLRLANSDLPKLRNQVRQLRRQAEELSKLKVENQGLQQQQQNVAQGVTNSLPPNFIRREALRNAGFGTPEATVQTYFWAMCQGNIERMHDCTMEGREGMNQDQEWERKHVADEMKGFAGFSIIGRQDLSPGMVELELQSSAGGVKMPLKLRLMADGWKID